VLKCVQILVVLVIRKFSVDGHENVVSPRLHLGHESKTSLLFKVSNILVVKV
jgi:hypothetical protein